MDSNMIKRQFSVNNAYAKLFLGACEAKASGMLVRHAEKTLALSKKLNKNSQKHVEEGAIDIIKQMVF